MLNVSDARVKIGRARAHLQEMMTFVGRWTNDEESRRFIFYRNPECAEDAWCVEIVKPLPPEIAVLGGECAASLHAALDYLTWAIFVAGGGRDDAPKARYIYFPIAPDGEQWRKDKNSKLPTAWPEAVECIKGFQPHYRTDADRELLLLLAAITARDKHRQLHVVGSSQAAANMTIQSRPPGTSQLVAVQHPIGPLDVGTHLISRYLTIYGEDDISALVPRWDGMNLDFPDPPSIQLGLLGTRTVALDDLERIIGEVERIVAAVEQLSPPP